MKLDKKQKERIKRKIFVLESNIIKLNEKKELLKNRLKWNN